MQIRTEQRHGFSSSYSLVNLPELYEQLSLDEILCSLFFSILNFFCLCCLRRWSSSAQRKKKRYILKTNCSKIRGLQNILKVNQLGSRAPLGVAAWSCILQRFFKMSTWVKIIGDQWKGLLKLIHLSLHYCKNVKHMYCTVSLTSEEIESVAWHNRWFDVQFTDNKLTG